MPEYSYFVKFDDAHKKSKKTIYRVVKDTGISRNTVKNFVDRGGYEVRMLDKAILVLAEYYGVDWKDYVTKVVRTVEESEEESEDPEMKAPLIA